ncbi:formyltransferase family protein [Marivibrio sp.]|uniref:formyltransferase family protein n=1 Tax=Marivibrio sp. TaxID=2039719 RepID=UPI0032EADD07
MAGRNRFGRLLLETLAKKGAAPAGVVLECETPRAASLEQWLAHPSFEPDAFERTVEQAGIDVLRTSDFQGDAALAWIADQRPDCLINGGGGIFSKALLDATPVGAVNAHPGLLPSYRGLDPVLWALAENGPLGATVHRMAEGLDTGPIFASATLPPEMLTPEDLSSVVALRVACMRRGAQLLATVLSDPWRYPPTPQDEGEARYFGRFPEDRLAEVEAARLSLRAAAQGAVS